MLENEEFPAWGGPRYYEPALKITRENGVRDVVLRYVSHRQSRRTALDIDLQDIKDDIGVTLHYRVYPGPRRHPPQRDHPEPDGRSRWCSKARSRPCGTCPPARATG